MAFRIALRGFLVVRSGGISIVFTKISANPLIHGRIDGLTLNLLLER